MKESTTVRQIEGERGATSHFGAAGECHGKMDQAKLEFCAGAVGIEAGSPLILGGPRSAELLQMFIENL